MPPEAIAATRWNTSSGIPAACALAMKVSAIAANAMLMPPEAEPVMPASAVTATASLTSGFGIAASASAITRKPGNAAITAPKPYSEAVFIEASKAPPIADFVPSAKLAITGFQAKASTVAMPTNNAPSTAQIAATLEISCTTGAAFPTTEGANSWLLPYSCGIHTVNNLLLTPTRTSGRTATSGLASLPPANATGSFTSVAASP